MSTVSQYFFCSLNLVALLFFVLLWTNLCSSPIFFSQMPNPTFLFDTKLLLFCVFFFQIFNFYFVLIAFVLLYGFSDVSFTTFTAHKFFLYLCYMLLVAFQSILLLLFQLKFSCASRISYCARHYPLKCQLSLLNFWRFYFFKKKIYRFLLLCSVS